MNRVTYIDMFSGTSATGKQHEALKLAHDIRKFEIELYWKRATYFWAFIAVAFAGFLASISQADLSNNYLIACLGLLFSLAWYLVNRGSSAWQRNWEIHVDLLEDEISGPLHKAIVRRRNYRFADLLGPYAYSPSRLNTALSLLLVLVWVMLACRTAMRIVDKGGGLTTVLVSSVLTLSAGGAMLFLCRSGPARVGEDIIVDMRGYK